MGLPNMPSNATQRNPRARMLRARSLVNLNIFQKPFANKNDTTFSRARRRARMPESFSNFRFCAGFRMECPENM
eukprot:2716592-Pyramimonas_sp.AAC.1